MRDVCPWLRRCEGAIIRTHGRFKLDDQTHENALKHTRCTKGSSSHDRRLLHLCVDVRRRAELRGQARGVDRLAEYTNNLRKRRDGKPYRASDPDGWRAVHDRMYEAHLRGEAIGLRIVPSTPDSPPRRRFEHRESARRIRVTSARRRARRPGD